MLSSRPRTVPCRGEVTCTFSLRKLKRLCSFFAPCTVISNSSIVPTIMSDTHTSKTNTLASMRGTYSYLQKERNMHYQNPAFMRRKNTVLSKFSARHMKTFAFTATVHSCHYQIMISASNAQKLRPHLLS